MQVIIFGNQQNAELAKFYLEFEYNLSVACFCIDGNYIKENNYCKKPIIPFEEISEKCNAGFFKFFAPLSDNELREKKYLEIKNKGYEFVSFVSPKCVNYGNNIGDNCFILENNTIQYGVTIGNNNIIWSGNHIGHHSTIKDCCFVSSHVVICGNCKIEKYSWIGVNSSIKEWITIGEKTILGMGSNVLKDTMGGLYYGSPARKMD